MSPLFGSFQVRVDPWEVDYGSETPLESTENALAADVGLDAEMPAEQWTHLAPRPGTLPERLFFVDGVRRLEARLLARQGATFVHGGFGSFAVGCVEMRSGRARFGATEVGREVVLGSGHKLPSDVPVFKNLTYAAHSVLETEPDAPLRTIQADMRRAEVRLARRLAELTGALVVTDGPLGAEGKANAVGLIKRIQTLYLPESFVPLLATLPPRMRTPLFSIHGKGQRSARLAWFVRLAAATAGESEMHGLIRLEASEAVGVDRARTLADLTAAFLPNLAPSRGRDPRSPQNLLPIGALENRLRHALGDQRLVRRWIQTLVARESIHARS